MNDETAELERTINDLERELGGADAEVGRLEDTADTLRAEVEDLKLSLETVEGEKADAETRADDFEAEGVAARERLEEETTRADEAVAKVEGLESDHDRLVETIGAIGDAATFDIVGNGDGHTWVVEIRLEEIPLGPTASTEEFFEYLYDNR